MGKGACKKKNFEDKENPKYECRKCGAKVKKEEKVCKPQKINHKSTPKSTTSH